MFHEKFGWMLGFWNIAGVPFLYCFQSLYIQKNQQKIDAWWVRNGIEQLHTPFIVVIYILLFVAYYIFDTANCQKASLKLAQTSALPGEPIQPMKTARNTFPRLPWGILEGEIAFIETPHGKLLCDGWYAFARKMQYTGDIIMAFLWGVACGFESLLPYFYLTFFTAMICHRQWRDEVRCSEKYGVYWEEYTKKVPNVFLPGWSFFNWLLTGEHPTRNSIKSVAETSSPTPSFKNDVSDGIPFKRVTRSSTLKQETQKKYLI
jgi:delta24(24(1))-sterol reductase